MTRPPARQAPASAQIPGVLRLSFVLGGPEAHPTGARVDVFDTLPGAPGRRSAWMTLQARRLRSWMSASSPG